MYKGIERRKYERIKVRLPAEFIFEGDMKNAVIEDIGGGGIRLSTNNPIFKSPLILQFCLEIGKSSIITKGKVVWNKCLGSYYETGVQFISISEEDRDKIIDYVKDKFKNSNRRYAKFYTCFPNSPTTG